MVAPTTNSICMQIFDDLWQLSQKSDFISYEQVKFRKSRRFLYKNCHKITKNHSIEISLTVPKLQGFAIFKTLRFFEI